jgi:transglutaminase-like putative cysteine protease
VKYEQQVPRNALAWIIITQFAILIPHLFRTPIWVLFVYLGAAIWRTMIYQGRWPFPGRYTKMILLVACFGGVTLSYRSLIGLEPTVALLLIAYSLKLVELASRRDAYMAIFIAYFVCTTEFLFGQELLTTAYMVFAVLLNTTSLVALHQPGQDRLMRSTLRRASVMLLQAFPLMLLLFFVFPRVGPLWSVPLKAHTAKTGVSDFMSPGDIANLGLNDDVAFRVQFEGRVPPKRELYWRGMVFSKLQNDAWRSLRWREVPLAERRIELPERTGRPLSYRVVMEPTQQNWLFAIPYADTADRGILRSNDFRLVSPVELQEQREYAVQSWPSSVLEPELGAWRRDIETTLPATGNPRTRELAREMLAAAGGDHVRYADSVVRMFTEQPFFYTLRPPVLGDSAMDQFLFESRRGFCEHYAAAFAWMMRAVGVPARVVAGYQGGEVNPVNGTVIVHQFDAHAWNEVWLEGRGWERVDPTGAIAPNRVEYGLEQALQGEGSFLSNSPLSPLRFRNVNWLNSLRLQMDAINYSWQLFVLRYDSDTQYRLLNQLVGKITQTQLVIVVVAFWCVLLLPMAITLVWQRRGPRADPATRAYLAFCGKLERAGLGRLRQEAPGPYALRIASLRPELAADVKAVTRAYEALAYRDIESERGLALLQRQVRRFRAARV